MLPDETLIAVQIQKLFVIKPHSHTHKFKSWTNVLKVN